ncbi:MAG: prephenate dehydratase [Solirubrobacteraceae bacterium]|nr:prephenate dehydratase [Solirubrobacteraceae bacterium]
MVRLGHLGPAGTFTEEAARAAATPAGAELVPYPTVADTVEAVLAGEVDAVLVPIENSLEGSVTTTVDALSAEPRLHMVGETVLAIRHCLIAREPTELARIEAVLSHPQALAQCTRFLRERLPAARLVPTGSTAEGVQALAAEPPTSAAIASRIAARVHGGVIVCDGIEDDPGNATRFAWLAADDAAAFPAPDGSEQWKTSILFAGADDARPGWLVRCLSELASRGVNLVKIESRPARSRLGHYLFLADCEGRSDDAAVAEALEGLRAHCDQLRVLGTYPAAPAPSVS